MVARFRPREQRPVYTVEGINPCQPNLLAASYFPISGDLSPLAYYAYDAPTN